MNPAIVRSRRSNVSHTWRYRKQLINGNMVNASTNHITNATNFVHIGHFNTLLHSRQSCSFHRPSIFYNRLKMRSQIITCEHLHRNDKQPMLKQKLDTSYPWAAHYSKNSSTAPVITITTKIKGCYSRKKICVLRWAF